MKQLNPSIDPYVAEIMKRNEQMAYLLGRAESLFVAIEDSRALRDEDAWLQDEVVDLIEDISNYYGDL